MPYGDGTGPYGSGPIGWRRGPCAGDANRGWPIWRGLRSRLTADEERQLLETERQRATELLDDIERRLAELKQP